MQAIELISEQGEGFGGRIYDAEHELAHYYRFEQLVLGRYYQDGDLPGQPSGPELTVDWDAAFPSKTDAAMADYPRDSELLAAAEQFNRVVRGLPRTAHPRLQRPTGVAARCGGGHVPAARSDDPADPQPDPRAAGVHAAPTFEVALLPAVSGMSGRLERFLAFSAEVTAFPIFDLRGTGLAETHLAAVEQVVGSHRAGCPAGPLHVRRRGRRRDQRNEQTGCAATSSATPSSVRSRATSSSCGTSASGTSCREPGPMRTEPGRRTSRSPSPPRPTSRACSGRRSVPTRRAPRHPATAPGPSRPGFPPFHDLELDRRRSSPSTRPETRRTADDRSRHT